MASAIDQDLMHKMFSYCPETGVINRNGWKKTGCVNGTGYLQISVNKKIYNAHRLIWLHFYGALPKCDIDHINGIRTDNRISNLRLATRSQNLQNVHKTRSDNKSGFIGVHYSNYKKKFIAKIELRGKTKQIGYFNSAAEAGAAYLVAKRELHEFCTI